MGRILPLLLSLTSFVVAQSPLADPSKISPGEHSVEVNRVRIWYTVEGNGPIFVVQAPGWGAGSSYLRNGLAPLERHFTLIFYDPRGSGHSGRPDEKHMTPSDVIDDLEQLQKYWGLKSLRIIGHSDGGALALGYAIRHPELVSVLILVDSAIYGCKSCQEDVAKNVSARKPDERFTEAIKALEEPPPHGDKEFAAYLNRILPLYFYDPRRAMPAFQKTFTELPSAFAANTYYSGNSEAAVPEIGHMDRIKARTLILVGRDDFICSPVIARQLQTGIPKSKMVTFDNTGHFPWIESPEVFFNEVVHFAAGH